MQVLRAADRIATPWKNGGGVTREVAIWPPNASLTAFDWRISIADIEVGGPFSVFPGVDRVLTVIAGRGLTLRVEGIGTVAMDAASPPLAFPGEAACEATLGGGEIRDLNLMVRRGAYVARARRGVVDGVTALESETEATLVLALDPLTIGGQRLGAEDAALLGRGEVVRLSGVAARIVVGEIDLADAVSPVGTHP